MAGGKSDIQFQVFGVPELDELFNDLRNSQKKSVLISAFRKASKPLVVTTKNNLRARTKTKATSPLSKSIGVKAHRSLPILQIGARKGGRFGGFHAHLLESGTNERFYAHKGTGNVHKTGRIRATNFFADAVAKEEKGVIDSVQDQIIESFKKFIRRANAKRKT
jgi:hypothetical protein